MQAWLVHQAVARIVLDGYSKIDEIELVSITFSLSQEVGPYLSYTFSYSPDEWRARVPGTRR
jgi:hypothetical protein